MEKTNNGVKELLHKSSINRIDKELTKRLTKQIVLKLKKQVKK